MKKLILLAVFAVMGLVASAQATSQLNFGIIGVAYDIPVTTDIAVSPFAGTDLNLNYLTLGVKGNYYFDNLFELPSAWDVYAGANAGYWFATGNSNVNDFGIGLQVGGRWFWSEKWGLYLELGGGNLGGTGGLGLTMRL